MHAHAWQVAPIASDRLGELARARAQLMSRATAIEAPINNAAPSLALEHCRPHSEVRPEVARATRSALSAATARARRFISPLSLI